ncbi:thioredoxin domain-containing protein [Lacrimispora sp.]|uniref:thioredoxin domain-containing protein n=1 Tax=Lacrimispora sp. TaxID=2719234 RepID=UPI0034608DF2
MPDSNKVSNKLINEKSPYLLQHAYNPVSWYPWGGEAFEKAKAEDKPVFLSIGYSTCHWCHVMAHESFEDEEVAEVLNRDYVAVKVDREERPDIDSVYMFVCQALTGSGGWPLTIIMTPEQKPFYAATYLPKLSRWGSAGLLDTLSSIQRLWKNDRDRVLNVGEELTGLLNKENRSQSETGEEPSEELLKAASNTLSRAFDKQWGGFHRAPKFPMAHNLIFLFRHYLLEGGENVLSMTEKTLKQMYRGGMYDHIGGGFSRYSTDEKWLVPHFEKMLYDNALLLYAYTEGFQITGNPFYAMVSRGILDYILSVLTDKEGGFYCGQDADSEGVEGKFYTFEKKEITDILGEEQGEVFCQWFGITEAGNFEGKNIPNLIGNEDFETENQEIKELCQKLYQYRLKRTTLHTDDKILTSWNGLMIAGVAKAYKVLGDSRYLEAAQKAQTFIEKNLKTPDNRLFIRYRDGEAVHDGQLDDYAFYAFGLLELYEASFSVTYLKEAEEICEKMVDLFFDEAQGGFYMYAHDRDRLISRPMEFYDGALPSGNSAAAYVLSRLYHLTGEVKWQDVLQKQFSCMAGAAAQSPANHCFALMAFQTILYPSVEIVAVSAGEPGREEVTALQRETTGNISLLWKTEGNQKELSESAPFTADYPIPESKTRYYVCSGGACLQPVDTMEEVRSLMKTLSDRMS